MTVFVKDPASDVDFSIDWSDWLQESESISSTVWSVTPNEDGGLVPGGTEIIDGQVRGIFVSGGNAGHRYRLTSQILTNENRRAERSLVIRVMEL